MPLIVALYVAVRLPGFDKDECELSLRVVVLLNMKLAGLVTLALFEASALAFSDTAPFFSSRSLGKLSYYEESTNLGPVWTRFTNDICSSNKKTIVFRVNNLQHHGDNEIGSYVEHVHYKSAADLDLPLGDSCGSDQVSYQQTISTFDKPLTIIDVEDNNVHSVSEFTDAIKDPLVIVVVQGKPSFHKTSSHLEDIKNFVENKVYDNLNIELGVHHKRSDTEDYDKIAAEVEADFAKAESLVSKYPHGQVTALSEASVETSTPSYQKLKNLSLFTEYRFFTPGIWLGLIVSAMLITVLVTALLWIGSLDISYKSFDKQVDYEKKNE